MSTENQNHEEQENQNNGFENNANENENGNENFENLDNQNNQNQNENLDEEGEEFEAVELDANMAWEFLKKEKGIEANDIDELLTPKQKNDFEDIIDDEDKLYFKYKKQFGGNRKDFENFTKNLDEVPRIEFARERVRKESGLNLTDEEADNYIASELGIIDLNDLDVHEKIKLAGFAKPILESKKEEQNNFLNSQDKGENKEQENKNKSNSSDSEFVQLDNGSIMRKTDYDNFVKNRELAIEEAKQAVNSVTSSVFNFEIDDNGTKKELSYSYDFSEEDKQRMLSNASNYDAVLNSRYSSEEGFNHAQFAVDFEWANPEFREKAIASILHKAIAENTETILKERGNVNFSQGRLQQGLEKGVKIVSVQDAIRGI